MRIFLSLVILAVAVPALGVHLEEKGQLPYGKNATVKWQKKNGQAVIPVYRVQSFGQTELEVELKAADDGPHPLIFLEGPLKNDGDDTPPLGGRNPIAAREGKRAEKTATLKATLSGPGVYRVVLGSWETLIDEQEPKDGLTFKLSAQCKKGCYRPEITTREFLKTLSTKELTVMLVLATARLNQITSDTKARERLAKDLKDLIAQREGAEPRFPVMPPLHRLKSLQSMLGGQETNAKVSETPIRGDLAELLAKNQDKRVDTDPKAVHENLSEILYGHFTDRTLPISIVRQSTELARVLTSLVTTKSTVTWDFHGKNFTMKTPKEVFSALLATGHKIQVRNERTFANFIALVRDGKYVRWPAWIDTGIPLTDKKTLVVPMGHSQHAWIISGPAVNARVMFFLGMNGVGFFPRIDERPVWTGYRAEYTVDSGTPERDAEILSTISYATIYLKQLREEAATVAKGMPAHGYGYLGICNDSNAFVEQATRGTQSTYPWVRNADLLVAHPVTAAEKLFSQLVPDTQWTDQQLAAGRERRTQVLCRVRGMNPYPLDSPLWFDKELLADLKTIEAEVGNVCHQRE